MPLEQNTPRNRNTAILLAVFFGFWTWAYTFKEDRTKFWLNLGLSVFFFIFWYPIAWFWAIGESLGRTAAWYQAFPNGNLLREKTEFVAAGANMALVGSALLALSLFLPWFRQGGGLGDFQDEAQDAGFGGGSTFSAFDSIEASAFLLLALALVGVFIAVRLRGDQSHSAALGYRFGLVCVGVVSLAIVSLNVAFPPQIQFFAEGPMDLWFGIIPAFLSAGLLIVGGCFVIRGDQPPTTIHISGARRSAS